MFDFDHQFSAPGKFPKRLFLSLFLPVALLIVGGAWYVGKERATEEAALTASSEIGSVVMAVRRLDDELRTPLRQLRTLANENALKQGVGTGAEADLRAMEALFANLIAYNGQYDKVRWIDETGRERVRVNNVGGRPLILTNEQLQALQDAYYYKESRTLKPGEIYISPMDLNVEYGQVEKPHKPMLRLVTPLVGPDGKRNGALVLNVSAQSLLEAFTNSLIEARDHAMLLNSEGYWLKSPDGDGEWGFMFGRDDTLASQNPNAWKTISEIPSGQVELGDGLWTWSTVYPLKVDDSQDARNIPTWLVAAHLPAEQLALQRQSAWRTVGLFGLGLLVLYGALAAWLARVMAGRAKAIGDVAKAQAEAAAANRVRQAQERFRLVVEANTNGLLVADKTGRIVLINSALARMFGYANDDLLGQPLELLLPESARPGHATMFAAYLANPASRPMGKGRELYGRRKDGGLFPIEISLSPFTENGETFVDAFVADITERKQVEQLHRRIEARLQLMMQTSPVGLMVVDDQGAIEMANPALEHMFGYGTGELYNQPIERLLPKASQQRHVQLRQEYLRAPSTRAMGAGLDLHGVRKNGEEFSVSVGLASFEENGRVYVQATVTEVVSRS
jgi:PAS domain S-box-containing protein